MASSQSSNRLQKLVSHLTPSDTASQSTEHYRYTASSSSNILTADQKRFYEENGFIVIKKLLSPQDIDTFYNRFDELVQNPKLRHNNMIVMRDVGLKGVSKAKRTKERVVTKLQAWSRDPVFWDYAKHKEITKYAEAIVGPDLRGVHFMAINKPSDPGTLSSRHPLHQDGHAFPFQPFDKIVCSWTALQRIHRSNGCLVVCPGTHRMKLYQHSYPKPWNGPVNGAYFGIQYDGDINTILRKRVHLEMDPGDTVFFHPLLIHGSGANLTNKNRRSISVHYVNSKEVGFKRNIPEQRNIADEVERLIKKVKGKDIKFATYWKMKSRQIRGDEGAWKMNKHDTIVNL